MSFLRHVGKIGDRKVAIIFREVPGEPHMCLVTYTETLNRHIHDPMMQCIESSIGQSSENLADALNRTHTKDGKFILQLLHSEGLIKKVQTSQVVVTPNNNTRIKLEELNQILNEMQQGENAIRRLAELDASRGIHPGDPAEVARMMRNTPVPQADGVLGDNYLAQQRLQQAQKMEAEARGLLAESQRLMEEAKSMDPSIGASSTPAPKKRGRPAKAKTQIA
jgi:hypothetical protein